MTELRIADGSTRMAYRRAGAGPPILLVHGFPFTSAMWEPQIDGLKGAYDVLAPDLRGFGASPPSAEPYALARLADDLAELLDALDIERAVIGGLSMGGYVSFEFFRRHPHRVTALVLADTKPEPDSPEAKRGRAETAKLARDEGTAALADQLLPKLLAPTTREERPELEAVLHEMMTSATPEAVAAALEAMARRADSREILERIDVPALVIGGREDALTPPDQLRAWAKRIADARLHIIEGAGHVSNLERPHEFNRALLDFLAGLSDVRGRELR